MVERALRQYKKGEDPRQTILEFYQEDKNSISAFFARSILDTLLQNPQQEECKITWNCIENNWKIKNMQALWS